MFEKSPAEVNAYLANPGKYLAAIQQASDAAARGQLENVVEILVDDRCVTFQDCVAWARKKFEVRDPRRLCHSSGLNWGAYVLALRSGTL